MLGRTSLFTVGTSNKARAGAWSEYETV